MIFSLFFFNTDPENLHEFLFYFRFVDKWILSQCAETVAKANDHLQHLELHLLTRTLRHFLYSCLCDVYVEAVKKVLNDPNDPRFEATLRTLFLVLRTGLQLMHPLMPFITEELYQRLRLGSGTDTSIMAEAFPTANEVLGLVRKK